MMINHLKDSRVVFRVTTGFVGAEKVLYTSLSELGIDPYSENVKEQVEELYREWMWKQLNLSCAIEGEEIL